MIKQCFFEYTVKLNDMVNAISNISETIAVRRKYLLLKSELIEAEWMLNSGKSVSDCFEFLSGKRVTSASDVILTVKYLDKASENV